MGDPDYKQAFYELIASLTLADHLGDVGNDIIKALDKVGDGEARKAAEDSEELELLGSLFYRRGITTLYGTELSDEQERS